MRGLRQREVKYLAPKITSKKEWRQDLNLVYLIPENMALATYYLDDLSA